MEVAIEIEKRGEQNFYYLCKHIDSGVLWINKKKNLVRHKGERACVRDWKHAVLLLGQILNGDIN